MVGPNTFAKTICSICYEDLKPIVEDLQAISICGHVFHELCLQQWFEYCTDKKKQTCPVCKQGCTKKSVGRLYFQSIGDPILSQSQIEIKNPSCNGEGENPEVLRREIKRLEAKVSGLCSVVELHQKDVKQLSDELHVCKEQLSKEVTLKNEALRQKECIQSILQTKSSDLVKSNLECSRLQENNLALVKEIAAVKLVSDCNLEEEEIVKLATLGHESSQDSIDVLKKSLVIRNKSYKELMAKCSSLGRGEARTVQKLEKAQEKILKLKTKVQELETIIEEKENQVLRSLKASKKRNHDDATLPNVNKSSEPSSILKNSLLKQNGQSPTSVIDLDDENDIPFVSEEINNEYVAVKHRGCRTLQQVEIRNHECSIQNVDEPQKSKDADTHLKGQNYKEGSQVDLTRQPSPHCESSGLSDLRSEVFNARHLSKESSGLDLQDIKQVQPLFKSNIEASSSIPLAEPGNRCFTGGLLGPDGANRYLGKWCKRAQNKAPLGSNNDSDTLIAVGADGRGGTVKVLRSFNQTFTDSTHSNPAKRFKSGVKTNGLQSQRCRQIDHFFKKATN